MKREDSTGLLRTKAGDSFQPVFLDRVYSTYGSFVVSSNEKTAAASS